jgi:uncharacterized protein YkwD
VEELAAPLRLTAHRDLGRFDQQKLFDIWMHSAGHRRNMLDPDFTRFGLAYVRDGRDSALRYWSLVLGK